MVGGWSLTLSVSIVDGSAPKEVPGKLFSGIKLMGESGDEDGEGSDNEDVSVVSVVVGDESAEFCVEVLSWCRCSASAGNELRCCCCSCWGIWLAPG